MRKNKLNIVLNVAIYMFAIWGMLLTAVFFAMKLGFTKSDSNIDRQSEYFKDLKEDFANGFDNKFLGLKTNEEAQKEFDFIESLEEMKIIKTGLLKDYYIIDKVSKEVNISKRLLVTPLIVEQLRLMTSQREIFKKYFQPLSVLGSQTQFSLGIYGIKEDTAKNIEKNLKDRSSPFYIGYIYENLLDYEKGMIEENRVRERIKRLTDEKDHYYSYLYAAIYMKQIMHQWQSSFDENGKSFNIEDRPEILMTLYNLGFEKSIPKKNPEVGGAAIDLYDKSYTFGSLSFYFYYSVSMREIFD